MALLVLAMAGVLASMPACGMAQQDYAAALSKSLLYFEAQRSGRLPPTQRVQWRGHSALNDGADHGVSMSIHECSVHGSMHMHDPNNGDGI
jgi:hypothetical protein